jgi:nucleoside-diphosphate-sugar epimerase
VPASDPVLVTGAFGLVGTAVVKRLLADGRRVVATDLDIPANRKSAAGLIARGVEVRWVDLTEPDQVNELLASVSPCAIVHLAAIIPPQCYARRALARAVNVDATASLVRAASAQSSPPRFVQASSVAVYGPRNPHTISNLLTADTPVAPSDNYGAHKVEAEKIVTSSGLDWAVLRLGAVMSNEPRLRVDLDSLYFEAAQPADGRIQTVDVRDVATAFCAATTTDRIGEVFLIGGDDSHRRTWADLRSAITAAVGLVGGMPPGRPGNPGSDRGWFATDWMDTARSQRVLTFQHHTWPGTLANLRANVGLRRCPLRLAAPFVRGFLWRRSPYYRAPGRYADPWTAMRAKWGDQGPDAGAS